MTSLRYFAKISNISAGVTTMGALGKCFLYKSQNEMCRKS